MPALTLGRWLREAREQAHLTQSEAAHRIGVSRPTLSTWEHDTRPPNVHEFAAMVRIYCAPWLYASLAGIPSEQLGQLMLAI